MRIRFTTRTMLILTTLVAALLGGFMLLKHITSINPDSLRVQIGGELVELEWQEIPWQPGHTGIGADNGFFHSAEVPAYEDRIQLEQPLLSIDYNNHLGICDYAAWVHVEGFRNEAWDQFDLRIRNNGGGLDDAAVNCEFNFDPERKILHVELSTWVNSKRVAKKSKLNFVYDGDKFVLQR